MQPDCDTYAIALVDGSVMPLTVDMLRNLFDDEGADHFKDLSALCPWADVAPKIHMDHVATGREIIN